MDKMGVHSPTNVEKAIVSTKGTTSLVQTVAGKDSSNLLMLAIALVKCTASTVQTVADTDSSNSLMPNPLPKSVRILPSVSVSVYFLQVAARSPRDSRKGNLIPTIIIYLGKLKVRHGQATEKDCVSPGVVKEAGAKNMG
ncbi:hypothetical protein H5410_014316 [Solanum commersonii]|uniref:Uncharacterized protein n=1 Tax=Solanum commersonii TaxID=4109 RepID=A0A9J5ZR12_SOLCO|nr:hypothetical protein H5410_014316 [Solanum commersonii]